MPSEKKVHATYKPMILTLSDISLLPPYFLVSVGVFPSNNGTPLYTHCRSHFSGVFETFSGSIFFQTHLIVI
jgi:hypothetical protein